MMPSYYQNPYAMTPTYGQAYAAPQQQSFTPVQQPIPGAIIGVDGEAAARAYQMPAGIQPGTPIALWDTNEQVIYLKSVNQMGMPNPLQKIRYQMDEKNGGRYGEAQRRMERIESGDAEPVQVNPDMSEYARKDDLESMKKEILDSIRTMNEAKGAKTNGKSAV